MKGYRTLLLNGAGVAGLALLNWAAGVDWTQYVSPNTAVAIALGVNMGLRLVTTGPVGKR